VFHWLRRSRTWLVYAISVAAQNSWWLRGMAAQTSWFQLRRRFKEAHISFCWKWDRDDCRKGIIIGKIFDVIFHRRWGNRLNRVRVRYVLDIIVVIARSWFVSSRWRLGKMRLVVEHAISAIKQASNANFNIVHRVRATSRLWWTCVTINRVVSSSEVRV